MNEENVNLAGLLNDAISSVIADLGGGAIVTRWVLSVERFTSDGERSTAHIAADGMQSWEVVGMCEMASEYARVHASAGLIEEMYSDLDDNDDED